MATDIAYTYDMEWYMRAVQNDTKLYSVYMAKEEPWGCRQICGTIFLFTDIGEGVGVN